MNEEVYILWKEVVQHGMQRLTLKRDVKKIKICSLEGICVKMEGKYVKW